MQESMQAKIEELRVRAARRETIRAINMRRVVLIDIKSPRTVTLPWPIEEVMAGV